MKYNSAQEFLDAVDALMENPELRKAASQRSEEIAGHFDKEAFGEAIEQIYESVL